MFCIKYELDPGNHHLEIKKKKKNFQSQGTTILTVHGLNTFTFIYKNKNLVCYFSHRYYQILYR